MRYTPFIVLAVVIQGCFPVQDMTTVDRSRLDQLIAWMGGSFDSSAQAEEDQQYYNISLHMYPVWTDRLDGPWLYVEQAMSARPNKPYRQRMYQLVAKGNTLESHVYELPDPESVVGGWKGGTALDEWTPADLIPRKGCAVYLTWNEQEKAFVGSTLPNACSSDLRGAKYAESKVTISQDHISSWDRGFDNEGQQVWGAEKGPYIFRRKTELPD